MKNKYGIVIPLLLAAVVMAVVISNNGSILHGGCDELLSIANDPNKLQYIGEQVSDLVGNANNLKIIASAGDRVYSHELPVLFSKLNIGISLKRLGFEKDDVYIEVGGDWHDMSGNIDADKISFISIGESPRRYLKIGYNGYELPESNHSIVPDGVVYMDSKVVVYCK